MQLCKNCDGRGRVFRNFDGTAWVEECPDHPACRWPDKVAYLHAGQAALELTRMRARGRGRGVTVYQCRAGHWHLGNADRFAKVNEKIPPRRGRSRR